MNIQLQFSNTKLSKSSSPCLSLCEAETDNRVDEMKTVKKGSRIVLNVDGKNKSS